MLLLRLNNCLKIIIIVSSLSACAGAAITAPAAQPHHDPNGRESWAWLYTNFQPSMQAIANNANAFTHISPVFYSLNYDYKSGVAYYFNCASTAGACTNAGGNNFGGSNTAQITAQLAGLGIATIPGIFAGASNHGVDIGVQNILRNAQGEADSFIASMVQEAVTNGYAGYNLDWETGAGVTSADSDSFISFVNTFEHALAAHGMSLSIDAIVSNIDGTFCSSNKGYLDFNKLSASAVDKVVIEDYTATLGPPSTSCQPVILSQTNPVQCPLNSAGTDVTVTGLLNFACSNLPANKVVIGLAANSQGTNAIAGQVFSTLNSYGFSQVAVWPESELPYPFLSSQGLVAPDDNWYHLLSKFLNP